MSSLKRIRVIQNKNKPTDVENNILFIGSSFNKLINVIETIIIDKANSCLIISLILILCNKILS